MQTLQVEAGHRALLNSRCSASQRRNRRRVAVGICMLLVTAAAAGCTNQSSPASQLKTAFAASLEAPIPASAGVKCSVCASDWGTFASALGRINFPSQDYGDAHAVIRAALVLRNDATYGSSSASDDSELRTFSNDLNVLFADLGLKEPIP
jgi:hypothetical protein